MVNRSRLFWDKFPVWVIGFCLLGLTYWPLRGMFYSADPVGPSMLDFPGGLFLTIFLLISAIVIVPFTISERTTSSLFALFLASGGVCLRSGRLNELIVPASQTQAVFGQFIATTIWLLGIAAVLTFAIQFLRKIVRKFLSALAYKPLFQCMSKDEFDRLPELKRDNPEVEKYMQANVEYIPTDFAPDNKDAGKTPALKEFLPELAGFIVTVAAVGVIVSAVLMRSAERGQLIFSLLAGFTLAGYLAGKLFPTRRTQFAWCGAGLGALIIYVIAYFTQANVPLNNVMPQFQALPCDWFSAAGAGALLGAWLNQRAEDSNIAELLEQK